MDEMEKEETIKKKKKRRRRKKQMPVGKMILLDLLAIAVGLNVFALFHHALDYWGIHLGQKAMEPVVVATLPQQPEESTAPAEAPQQSGNDPAPTEPTAPQGDARPDFVPYVDDVPPAPKRTADPEIEPEGDDEDYIPSPWEERVNALTDRQWRRVQIIGGALLGFVALALLMIGGEELATYRLIVAALVALLVPRYVERVIRRDLILARRAMIVALLVGLVVGFLILGAQNGFQFTKAN